MKKIEGYWYSESAPQYPRPVPNSIDLSVKNVFINNLLRIQNLAHKSFYKGLSMCRICKTECGSVEYNYANWIWPEGYLHYVRDHNVAPSKEFFEFIMNRK